MRLFLIVIMSSLCFQASAQAPAQSASPGAAIEHVLAIQVDAWNRGDVNAFVSYYAENCVYVGKQVLVGRDKLLARYKSAYSSRAAMGKLTFSDLRVHPLEASVAAVTGNWHLDRPSSAGGPVGGIFSLVFQQRGNDWRIALDHTS